MADEPVFLYLAAYDSEDDARLDYDALLELLDSGEAGLIVTGRSKLEEALERELKRANRQVERELKVDSKELDKELAAAES
jgi:hypothetical protein